MPEESYEAIRTLLTSSETEELRRGLELARQEIPRASPDQAKSLFEALSTLFYIDLLDRPDLVPIVDEAVSLAAELGEWVIHTLIENLEAGDLKAQMAVSHAIGRIGAKAIGPLIAEYQKTADPTHRTFIMYAMGKIKSAEIVRAAHLALEAAQSDDLELRDTATRAIGKFVEVIPPTDLPEDLRAAFMAALQRNLADPNAGIRAKAVRSLGKLARYGHLTAEEREKLKSLCQLILGVDGNWEWDRAYIVRREAREALNYT